MSCSNLTTPTQVTLRIVPRVPNRSVETHANIDRYALDYISRMDYEITCCPDIDTLDDVYRGDYLSEPMLNAIHDRIGELVTGIPAQPSILSFEYGCPTTIALNPSDGYRSPAQSARGFLDVMRIAWIALTVGAAKVEVRAREFQIPVWVKFAACSISVFGLAAFCLIAVMEFWPGGAQ